MFSSLWFIHLPSHILQSEDRATSILRSAYELLNKFQKTGVHLLTDEVCPSVLFLSINIYGWKLSTLLIPNNKIKNF